MNRTPSISSSARQFLVGIVVLLFVCGAAAQPTANAATGRSAPQAQAVDPAANLWLIFIDDLHLDFTATGHLRDLFTRVTDTLVHEGDLFAVVSTGPSSIAIDLTRDRGRLTQAVRQIAGAALKPSEILQPVTNQEVRYRAHVSLSTAYSVMTTVALAANKRKAFIYLSNGYYIDLRPGASSPGRENPFLAGGNEYSLERLRAEVAELTRQATRSHVTIFCIDPRALSERPTTQPTVNDAAWQEYWTTTKKSLRVISEETGGHVIQDNVDENLKRIVSAVR